MWPAAHQGAGLLGFVPGQGPRLLPVLSHPGATLELEVLWQLARTLQDAGHGGTLVLDAGATERAAEPGLAQWLQAQTGAWPEGVREFAVVPAAQGMADLVARGGARALEHLADAVRHFSLVLLYAPPVQVAALFAGRCVSPLVLNVPGDAALLRSYALLKRTMSLAPLRCTVAGVAWRPDDLPVLRNTLQVLRQRCQQWLGESPRTVAVDGSDEEALGTLALQLMEGACMVQVAPAPLAHEPQRATTRYHECSMV